MKVISLREFCHNPTQFLDDLPLTLTQYNKPVVDVVPHSESDATSDAKPTIQEIKEQTGLKTADELPTTVTPEPLPEHWGNSRLHCNICSASPAAPMTYEDENGDQHEGIYCKNHTDQYNREHGKSKLYVTPTRVGSSEALGTSFNPQPKPEPKKKKSRF
jgi:hypothetical protein